MDGRIYGLVNDDSVEPGVCQLASYKPGMKGISVLTDCPQPGRVVFSDPI